LSNELHNVFRAGNHLTIPDRYPLSYRNLSKLIPTAVVEKDRIVSLKRQAALMGTHFGFFV